ncbi:MAG: polysaccharide biosynthesis tyrosine autokinase [Bacteroidales bacterium]|nr:polysaccharide biosynthesis tyrosine autokinase [Bacteroidales bacterium]
MQQNKIPIINEKFDPQIFLLILKKYIWLSLLFIILSLFGTFIYLRYTPPVYKSVSIIQVNKESSQAQKILNIEDIYEKKDISNVIELLRSKEFLKRVYNKLPLNIEYYTQGTFQSTELYKNSPFKVETHKYEPCIYNVPIFINFKDKNSFILQYEINGQKYKYNLKTNTWNLIYGGEIKLSVNNYKRIAIQQDNIKKTAYSFILNNPGNLYLKYINNLDIRLLNKYANTIQISCTSHNATKTSEIVNTIAEEYMKYDIEKKKESAQNILSFIDFQLKSVYENLDKTEKQIHEFKKENKLNYNILSNQNSSPIFTTKITEFQNEILNIDFQLVTLKRIQNQIVKGKDSNIYEIIAILSGTKFDGVIVNVLNNLQKLITEKQQLLNDVTSNNYQITTIDKQINNQRQLIIELLSTTINRLSEQKKDYKKKVDEYENKIFNNASYEVEYSKLDRLFSINEGFYHQLIAKKAEYLISQAGYVSLNEILEKSDIPHKPISPIKKNIILIFILIGIIISLVIIFIKYLIYDEVTSIENLKNYTEVPVLGAIPNYKKQIPISQLLVDKKPNSIFTESFRNIRSNLQFISHKQGPKIITITSTIAGEGKTFVAINLAGILSISNKKVILLDFDLRKPRIHLGFDTDNNKGISTILINQHSIEECIKHSDKNNFDFITAGPVPPNPSEIIMCQEKSKMLDSLKDNYDYIIIDTPPIGIVTDALDNIQKADYPIYVLKANCSKRYFINNINNLYKNKNLNNLSVILNGISLKASNMKYGYGYGYYDEENEVKKKSIINKLFKKLIHE